MTIKQNGGVFGRNPTFNDVTIEGQLTFDGDIDINSDLKVDGDLVVTGKIGVGTDTPSDEVEIRSTSPKIKFTDSNDDTSGFVSYNVRALLLAADGTQRFFIGGDEKVRILETSGDVSLLGGGNLVVNSGSGIDFSATSGTGTSELLDDYEEGEFAVTLTPSTSGSIALQAGADTMLYNKVGRVVHCQGQINVSSISSAVGSSIAVNLPFAKLNTTDASEASSGPVTYYNTSAYSVLPAFVPSSATQAFNIVIDPSTLANNHTFSIQFSYIAA